MTIRWMVPALLAVALAVGCGDRTRDDARETGPEGQTARDAAIERPEAGGSQVSAGGDGSSNAPAGAITPPSTTSGGVSLGETSARAPQAPGSTSAPRAPAAPSAPLPEWREVTVPAGTPLPLDLTTALSSSTAQVETPVRARLRQAVVVDGYTALPAGAVLIGQVTEVERPGRVQGRSRLAFRFTDVEYSGQRERLQTNPLTFEGEATRGEDATKIGAGAVGGAIIGGIVGGGDGAAKGAAIGGAAGTAVVLATRGRDVALAEGTNLAATLATPFTVRAPVR